MTSRINIPILMKCRWFIHNNQWQDIADLGDLKDDPELSVQLDRWILVEACKQLHNFITQYPKAKLIRTSITISCWMTRNCLSWLPSYSPLLVVNRLTHWFCNSQNRPYSRTCLRHSHKLPYCDNISSFFFKCSLHSAGKNAGVWKTDGALQEKILHFIAQNLLRFSWRTQWYEFVCEI